METDRLIASDGEEWAANTILSSLKLILPNDLIQLLPPIFIIIWGKRARDIGDGYEHRSKKEYVLWRGEITEWLEQIWIFLTHTHYAVWQKYQSLFYYLYFLLFCRNSCILLCHCSDADSGSGCLQRTGPPPARQPWEKLYFSILEPGLVYFLWSR